MSAQPENKQSEHVNQTKIFFIGALFFGTLFFVLSIYQFKYSLKVPFLQDSAGGGDKNLAKKENDAFMLQNMDTDHDGLSDYDELYVYNTSPYLEDTDSDGHPDKLEVENNTDPNCPEGRDCKVMVETKASSSPILEQPAAPQEVDVNFLRSSLLNEGVPPEILNQISDQELLQEYLGVQENGNTSNNTANNATEKTELKNLTPQEIRALLKEKGMDENVLNSIDDATLKKDFEDELNKL